VDLPDTGERANVDPALQLGTLIVPSNVPSTDTCTAGGHGWINFLDYRTGSYVTGATANMASTKIGASLVVGVNVVQLPGGTVKTIVTTADNQQLTQDTPVAPPSITGRRVSWRELIRE
jgi:type IV pilus assembly protein PilY1